MNCAGMACTVEYNEGGGLYLRYVAAPDCVYSKDQGSQLPSCWKKRIHADYHGGETGKLEEWFEHERQSPHQKT